MEGSSKLSVTVRNVGWGLARDIRFSVTGQFETDLTRANTPIGLAPGLEKEQMLYITPLRTGSELPLHLTACYDDHRGTPLPELKRTLEITVRDKAERRSDSTPQIIMHGGQVIQADSIESVAGGDQVNVRRTAQVAAAGAGHPAAESGPAPEPPPTITCTHCGQAQPADRFKCSGCGIPFVQCAMCGRYQPQRLKHCMHCGAAQ